MSTYGTLLKVTSFGESHGKAVGCVIDGFLPNITINFELIQKQLDRRRPNQSKLTSNRNEKDKLIVISGFENNITLGTPITFLIYNEDIKRENYAPFTNIPRPGHGDYTYFMKYHVKSKSGSSRFSGRETATRVAAGACIEQWLNNFYNCTIISYVHSVGNIKIPDNVSKILEKNPPSRVLIDTYGCVKYNEKKRIFMDYFNNTYDINGCTICEHTQGENLMEHPTSDVQNNRSNGDKRVSNRCNISNDNRYVCCDMASLNDSVNNAECSNIRSNGDNTSEWVELQTRCPHPHTAIQMCSHILQLKDRGDSIGGIATCIIKNAPIGIGEPIFDKMEAELAKSILSIPAVKGIEFGSGFNGSYMLGSEHNDIFIPLCNGEKEQIFEEDEEEEKKIKKENLYTYNDEKREEGNRCNFAKEEKNFPKNNFDNAHENLDATEEKIAVSKVRTDASNVRTNVSNKSTLLITKTNNCGGILAGITTGNNIVFRSAIKPVSSIQIEKETSDFDGKMCTLRVKGMHDCCILPRLPPIIEAASSITIGDMILRQIAKYGDRYLPALKPYN
ncbi:chorismate synthase, putative [Plasmodium ovale]|uniref:chorismate synthase n=2 Tax=Plasmodium ovale TaxID=36330 RepID=A0A1A8XED5_PLAOA|nr:chorismate synthase (CS) [Plasmodium ovale curtisi]SCP05041.1 chorismate synthase, putative [Plasmodium ovale]